MGSLFPLHYHIFLNKTNGLFGIPAGGLAR